MTKTTIKRVLIGLVIAVAVVLLVGLATAGYMYTRFVFTWQCKIYTGEMTAEGREVCRHYNNGGLWEVLTK